MNPWLGLASYTEDSLNDKRHFYGRDNAIETMVRKIRKNLFVTLYGRSGIGKSSLLKAGVFPILKKDNFFPVEIRFQNTEQESPLATYLWKTLVSNLEKEGISYSFSGTPYEPDFNDVNVLRYLFAAGEFIRKTDDEVISPVIVLDQFEETLYTNNEKASLLLRQLYALIDDNIDINVAHPDWKDNTNFRIVISIREDDLFLLEDSSENLKLSDFKENRYRLLPLTIEEAKDIILKPAPEIFNSNEIEEIADEIIRQTSTGAGGQINTIMLSLLCYLLYENIYNDSRLINLEDVKKYKDNLIESYYLETVKDLNKSERKYLEDNLVDEQGRRTFIYLSDLKENAPKAERFLTTNRNRLLNINQDKVEFVHDQLATAIDKIRNIRRKNTLQKITTALITFGLLFLLLFSWSVIPDISYKENIDDERIWQVSNNNKVEHLTIPQNATGDLYVSDCPNLKTITIKSLSLNLYVSNCPSLLRINTTSKDFKGSIYFYNCPILQSNNKYKVLDKMPLQGIKYEDFEGPKLIDSNINYSNLPYIFNNQLLNSPYQNYLFRKSNLDLNDTIKISEITCLVPFGYKDHFVSLPDFSGFKEIKEKPIYASWILQIKRIISWFYSNKDISYQIIIALFTVGCIMLLLFPKFFFFLFLSWISTYSFANNIFNFSSVSSSVIAASTTTIILCIVYRYKIHLYLKNNGKVNLKINLSGLKERLRKINRIIYILIAVVILGSITLLLYINHQKKKNLDSYLFFKNVERLIEMGQTANANNSINIHYDDLSSHDRQRADSLRRILINSNYPIKLFPNAKLCNVLQINNYIEIGDMGSKALVNPWTNETINLDKVISSKIENEKLNIDETYFAFCDGSYLCTLNLKTLTADTLSISRVDAFTFNNDGRSILYVKENKLVEQDLLDNSLKEYNFNFEKIKELVPLKVKNLVAATDNYNYLYIYDYANEELINKIDLPRSIESLSISANPDYILSDEAKINWKTGDIEYLDSDCFVISNGSNDFLIKKFNNDEGKGFTIYKNNSKKGKKFLDDNWSYRAFYCKVDPTSKYLFVMSGDKVRIYYIGDNPQEKFKPFVSN